MAILEIIKYPDKKLKNIAQPIDIIDKKTKNEIEYMIETMFFFKGIGLSSTQVNINKRIIIISINEKQKSMTLINPMIINNKSKIIQSREGCLSFPGIFVSIKRYKSILVKYKDINNTIKITNFDNISSICIQHEIDHLNGITIYERISSLKKKLINKNG